MQFGRVWIVQEIGTMAPATLFWGGTSEIDWEVLYTVCKQLTEFHELRRRFDIDTARIKFVYQRFVPPDLATRHANRLSFIYELHRARHLAATDPRDRIFAFLGHYSVSSSAATNPLLRDLVADYDKSTATIPRVYADAAARALLGGESVVRKSAEDSVYDSGYDSDENAIEPSLIALAAVQHEVDLAKSDAEWTKLRHAERENYMPSWVPDWRTYTSHIMSEPTSPHRASGGGSEHIGSSRDGSRLSRPVLAWDQENGTLRVRGVFVDVVARASTPIKPKAFHNKGKLALITQLWQDVCNEKPDAEGILFDLDRQYRGAGGAGCSAFLAFTQALSNGGAATALRWYDKSESAAAALQRFGNTVGDGDEARQEAFYRAIPEREWLVQGATYLLRALQQENGQARVASELQSLVDLAEVMPTSAKGDENGSRRGSGNGGENSEGSGPDADWVRSVNGATSNRVFACTKNGYYVLGPKVLAEGDVVCVLWGGKMCFCLRPLAEGRWLLVGECYVHGLMNGEAIDMLNRGDIKEQEFMLV